MQRCQRCVLDIAQLVYGHFALVRLRTYRNYKYASAIVYCLLVAMLPSYSWSAENMQATTSRAARLEATRAIPLKKIHPKYRPAIQQVLQDSSLYRRLPTQMVDCNPELFTYLAQNPETLVEIWRYLGITRVELQRTGSNTFRLSDNSGTTGKLTIVEQNCDTQAQNRIIMLAEGGYEGKPFSKPVRAQCVLLLRSGSFTETNDRDYVAARLDSFIRIDRTSIELFAKAVHPLVGRTADRNFGDTMQFISNFSSEAEIRPATIEKLVTQLPNVSHNRQQQLIDIAYRNSATDSRQASIKSSKVRHLARAEDKRS